MEQPGLVTPDGEKILRLRKEKGWSQDRLASEMRGPERKGVPNRGALSKAEHSKPVQLRVIHAIATALNVEVWEIMLDPEGSQTSTSPPPTHSGLQGGVPYSSDIPSASDTAEQNPPANSLPRLWNIPPRTPYFSGRTDVLRRLRTALVSEAPLASIQVLCGLGGVGKSQLAITYAHENKGTYQIGWWLRADDPAELAVGYTALALQLRLAERGADERMTIRAVRDWLEHHPDWLLIFNNAEDPASLYSYLPSDPAGHVLITSRNPIWQNIATPFPVEVFDPSESVRFLLDRTRSLTESQPHRIDSHAAESLARMLGHLPLALEHAAAHMVELRASFQQYIASYQRRKVEIFGGPGSRTQPRQKPPLIPMTGEYTQTVLTTWAMNIREVQERSPAAVDVLSLSAFLDPDYISLHLLASGGECLGPAIAHVVDTTPPDVFFVKQALLLPLYYFSLITCDEQRQSFSIHRLVQEVVRFQLVPEDRRVWIERKMSLLLSKWQSTDAADQPLRPELVTHAETLLQNAEELRVHPVMAAQIFHLAGNYLIYEASQYARAQRFATEAMALCEEYQLSGKVRAEGLCLLATVYWYQGEYAQASSLAQEAYRIYEAARKNRDAIDEEARIRLLNVRGLLASDQGQYVEAEEAYKQALDTGEKTLAPSHHLLGFIRNNLAWLYHEMGEDQDHVSRERYYAQAEALYRERLAQHREGLDAGITLTNLARLYVRWQRFEEAAPHLHKALQIIEETLGKENKYFAFALTVQGDLHHGCGRLDAARQDLEKALDIQKRAFERPMQHPDVVRTLQSLVAVYLDEGKLDQAQQVAHHALYICEGIFRFPHPMIRASRDLCERCEALKARERRRAGWH